MSSSESAHDSRQGSGVVTSACMGCKVVNPCSSWNDDRWWPYNSENLWFGAGLPTIFLLGEGWWPLDRFDLRGLLGLFWCLFQANGWVQGPWGAASVWWFGKRVMNIKSNDTRRYYITYHNILNRKPITYHNILNIIIIHIEQTWTNKLWTKLCPRSPRPIKTIVARQTAVSKTGAKFLHPPRLWQLYS